MIAQMGDYIKYHWLYTLKGWILWYKNYITIKAVIKKANSPNKKLKEKIFKDILLSGWGINS